MSISTKAGDKGQTGLYSGEQVWKDDLRVDAYGTLDELDAHIGEAKHLIHDVNLRHLLIDVQKDLYRVMGELASKDGSFPQPITATESEKLTALVHDFEQRMDLKGFVIPGSTVQSAKLDVCRTIVRRAERRIVALSHTENVPENILQYVNRLSDFFFIIARWIEKKEDAITYVKN
jgi:ATP:cob(I)alamin adenosyltransferase